MSRPDDGDVPFGYEEDPVAALAATEPRERGRSHLRASLGGKLAEFVPLALLLTFVPRALGPDDYGRFAFAWVLVTVLSAVLTADGLWLMSRFVPAAPPDQREALARALAVRLARRLAVIIGGVVTATVAVALAAPDHASAAILIGVALVADLVAALGLQIALGLGRVTLWSFRFAVQNSVLVVAVLVLYTFGGSTGAIAAVLIASLAACALAVGAAARPLRRASRTHAAVPAGAERFALVHGLSDVLEHVAFRGGVVAVAILSDSAVEAGYAAIALGLATSALYTLKQLFAAQLVGVTSNWAGDPVGTLASVRVLAERAVVALTLVAVVATAVRTPLLGATLGDDFRDASAALVPVLALLPLAPLAPFVGQTAALHLKARERLYAAAAGTAAFVIVALLTIPSWDAVGGSAALLAALLATIAAALILMRGLLEPRLLAIGLGGAAAVLAVAAAT